MTRFLVPLALLVTVVAARAETPVKPLVLLNGHDLAGWELVTTPANHGDLATACHYNPDGSLSVAGKPVSYLSTTATYENYHLHVEWRWPKDAAKNSNSGILLHIASGPTAGTTWPVCFQMQMKLTRAGDMLPMATAHFAELLTSSPGAKTPQLDRFTPESSEKPLGEWNACDITCRNDTIEVILNGVKQNRVTQCTPASGHIAIQLEGTPYELRNLRLDPLPRAIDSSLQVAPAPTTGAKFE